MKMLWWKMKAASNYDERVKRRKKKDWIKLLDKCVEYNDMPLIFFTGRIYKSSWRAHNLFMTRCSSSFVVERKQQHRIAEHIQ